MEGVAKSLTGLDIYDSEIKNYVKGDAQEFYFSSQFDVIIVGEVIEHLSNIQGLIDSSYASLKEGGKLIITTPNAYNFVFLKNAAFGMKVPNDKYHVLLFDVTTIGNMFTNFASNLFDCKIFYYYESNSQGWLYKFCNFVSKFSIGYSPGIVAELEKKEVKI
jgi:SAM-dependent methyltransferase